MVSYGLKRTNSIMNSFNEDSKLIFLLNGSFKALPPSYTKLRSYFNTYSSQVARHLKLEIPKHLISKSSSCPFCFTSWGYDTSSFKLVPGKKCSAKIKKLRKRLKKLGNDLPVVNQPTNKMVLKCLICRNTSTFPITKKSKPVKVKNVKDIDGKEVIKKKKKKKDKSCGLKMDKVPELVKSKDSQKKEKKLNTINKPLNFSSKKPEKQNNNSQKVAVNQVGSQVQKKNTNKDKNKLKALRNKIKENKNSTKQTLQGFLSLVRS